MRRLDVDALILSLWERLQACVLVLGEPPSFADKEALEEVGEVIGKLLLATEQSDRIRKFKGQKQGNCPHVEYPGFRRFIFREAHCDLVEDGTTRQIRTESQREVLGGLVECPGCGQVLFALLPAVSALVRDLRSSLADLGLGLVGGVFIEASGAERFMGEGEDTICLADGIFLCAPQRAEEQP